MPRAAKFKVAAIQDLLRQLEYAPSETRRRQMDAAEQLISDLDPEQLYPEDFIVFRITGYRPDRGDQPVMLVGEALLPDLVNLVQILSENLELPADRGQRRAITLDQVARRLRISHKSIQRYRKQGLVCHYIDFAADQKKLGCYEDSLERFIACRAAKLNKAANFTRINGEMETDLIAQARSLHETERLSLNKVALRLSRRVGRAHETIRLLLRRHDRDSSDPIFLERGPLRDREIVLIHRAWQRGVDPIDLAQRLKKSRPSIHRAVNRRRRDLLRTLSLSFVQLPTFDLPDAADVILSAPAVRHDLLTPAIDDGIELIDRAGKMKKAPAGTEDALIAAYNLLKMHAANGIASLGEWPKSETLDRIETDLRWVSLLRRKIIMLGVPAAIRRIEQNLGRALRDQAADEMIELLKIAFDVIANTVEGVDPARGQRIERVVGLAMDKALAKVVVPQAAGRAMARHGVGTVPMHDPFAELCAWDAWLNLRRDLIPFAKKLPQPMQTAVERRFGLDGREPLTLPSLGRELHMTQVQTVRLLQRAIRELRAASRG